MSTSSGIPAFDFATSIASGAAAPAGHECRRLLGEDVNRLPVVERTDGRHDRPAGTDVSGHERVTAGGLDLGSEEDRRRLVQLGDSTIEAMEAEPEPVAAERVRHEDP